MSGFSIPASAVPSAHRAPRSGEQGPTEALTPCPWCHGERVAVAGRWRCSSCFEWLGVQVEPIRSTRPQVIAVFYGPAKTR